jgi:hypothetical protein
MSDDEVEFRMTYPCYFLCGDRGGLVCIAVESVTCLCLFTQLGKLNTFQQAQSAGSSPDLAFPLEVTFATCDNAEELIDRLKTAEVELAASKVSHLAINPAPGQPIAYISIHDFIAALPRD